MAIIKSGCISNHIGITAGALSLSIKQVRTSGVARIYGQGGGGLGGGGWGGTSNKLKTEKKETKYVHIGAPN